MIIEKTNGMGGSWIDKKELQKGDIAKLTTEAKWVEGTNGKQLVAKIRIKGQLEDKNTAINTPTRNALIEAFGEDSNSWIGKHLTVSVESGIFAGKRGIALYLVPQGFEVKEDEGGYIVIGKTGVTLDNINDPEEQVDLTDIPF